MPRCPQCDTDNLLGTNFCTSCGASLVQAATNPNIKQQSQISTSNGLAAGLLGGCVGWMGSFVLGLMLSEAFPSAYGPAMGSCMLPVVCSSVGFVAGRFFSAGFMSCLIGWLIVSAPLYMAMGFGYAHDDPLTIPAANLIWCSLFSPLILGPLATVAGSVYSRNRAAGLILWLVPSSLILVSFLIASRLVGSAR